MTAAIPAIVLTPGSDHSGGRAAGLLLAAAAALFVMFEYGARTPALVDFRVAPPINRLRFTVVAVTLAAATLCCATGDEASALGRTFRGFAAAMDFPYSPVAMAADIFTRASASGPDPAVQYAAATAFCVAFASTLAFAAVIWFGPWPARADRLNLSVNLPTWDGEEGAAGAPRLAFMGAQVLVTAVALLFAMLVLGGIVVGVVAPDLEISPLALAWSATIWAAAPGAMALRGVALLKLAQRLREGGRGGRA